MYISTFNKYQELSKDDDIEKEGNPGDYVKPVNFVESNKTNSGNINNSDIREKINK